MCEPSAEPSLLELCRGEARNWIIPNLLGFEMIRNKCLLSIILALVCTTIYAQQDASTIRGRVVDADDSPVMYASVCLLAAGKVAAGVLTDTTGVFLIKGTFSGEFSVRLSSIGYEDAMKTIHIPMGQLTDVGRIVLTQKARQLDGVVVSGRTAAKSITMEKTRINPAATMSAATGSVLDVLRGSPSVSIYNSGQVSVRGNGNVLFLVDGVPTTLDGLGSIPVANVQSIDIVTSPDAKYDSEGTGGIISIVSKKQAPEAFSTTASANYGIDHFMNGNLAMSYNVERWGFRMNYNGKLEKDHIESELNRHVLQTGSDLEQLIDAAKKTTVHNIGLNFNYKATKRDILALDMKIGFPRMNNLQMMQNHYVTASSASDKLRRTDITFNREMVEGSLGYRHLFDPGRREVSIMLSLSAINGHRPSYYYEAADIANPFQQVQRSKSGGRPRIAAFQIDYMTPVGKGNLETGVKMTYRNNNIDHKMYEYDAPSDSWQLSIPLSNDLRHREYIPAAYAMYSSKFSSKLTYKAGLRLEYSRVTLQNDKEHLDEASNCFFVAPNLMLNYRVSKPWLLSLGVSRRISRPTYPQLNPYVNLIDNQTYETGNVRLEPEKVNKLDIGYSYAGQKLRLVGNAYLNYSQDYINQITYLDQSILVMSYINSDMDIKTGIEHNIRWNALRWLGIDLGSNIFYAKSRADWQGASFRNQGWTTNNSATMNIMPRKGMTIQAQYFVTSPQYFPQFATKTIHYCNLGIRQQLPKTGLTFSALLTDIFNTRRWDISSDNPVYTLVNASKNRSRVLWFGVSWNFHSRKSIGAQKGGTQRPGESQGGRQQEEDRSIIRLGE